MLSEGDLVRPGISNDMADVDFEDMPAETLEIADGVYCGTCAQRLSKSVETTGHDGLAVPAECTVCSARLRRFALS